ncbi:MAG: hypothetical protein AB8U44_04335 [Aaplasma endosymbiont of Hyalomma asiaticum]
MWSIRRNTQGETAGVVLTKAKNEEGAVYISGHASYREALMYAGSLSFLSSSLLWCAVHSLELASLPEDRIRLVKKSLILIATGMLICAYLAGMARTIIALEEKSKYNRLPEKEISTREALMGKIEPALYFMEALTCIVLACMSVQYVVTGERMPSFFSILGCVGSFLSITSSSVCIYKASKSDAEAEKKSYVRMRMSLRLLSILLSSTNICLCVANLNPSINMSDKLRVAIQLSVSIGWVIAFTGAVLLTRSEQLMRQQNSLTAGSGGAEIPSALQDMHSGVCAGDEISPPCIS